MGSLPELRQISSSPTPQIVPQSNVQHRHNYHPPLAPRHSFGAEMGLQIRPIVRKDLVDVIHGPLAPALLDAENIAAGKRRESCASSVGATSVRRLVRGGMKPGQGLLVAVSGVGVGPPNMPSHWITRAVCLVIARGFAAAALLPLQALPGAPLERLYWAPLLLGLLHATSALAALACPALIQLVSPTRVLSIAYILLTAFFATFLYPKVYLIIPVYIAAGLIWAPLVFAHEYIIGALAWERAGGGGASSVGIRRTLIRRLSRASRASRDAGLLITCLVLPMLPTSTSVYNAFSDVSFNSTTCFDKTAKSCMTDVSVPGNFARSDQAKLVDRSTEESWVIGVDDEEDAETCGANGCPWIRDIETPPRPPMLSIAFAILCAIAAFIVILSRSTPKSPSPGSAQWRAAWKALRDPKMRIAGPLALFIGFEQGFLYVNFMRWYVSCVSGGAAVWGSLAAGAILRALVACTLSMLLAHGRKRLVTAVGLLWHACLLLALTAWRAAPADGQLPRVMAAAWAGCDGVWELILHGVIDEPVAGGRLALTLSLRALGTSAACIARTLFCVKWSLRAMFLALPVAVIQLLLYPDR